MLNFKICKISKIFNSFARRSIIDSYKDIKKHQKAPDKEAKPVDKNKPDASVGCELGEEDTSAVRHQDYTPHKTAEGRSYGLGSEPFIRGVKVSESKDIDTSKDTFQDVRGRAREFSSGGQGSNQSGNNQPTPKDIMNNPKHPGENN